MKLGEYLALKDIKQRDFARKIGRSDAVVSRLVNGKQRPDFDTMAAIERECGGLVLFSDFADLAEVN